MPYRNLVDWEEPHVSIRLLPWLSATSVYEPTLQMCELPTADLAMKCFAMYCIIRTSVLHTYCILCHVRSVQHYVYSDMYAVYNTMYTLPCSVMYTYRTTYVHTHVCMLCYVLDCTIPTNYVQYVRMYTLTRMQCTILCILCHVV